MERTEETPKRLQAAVDKILVYFNKSEAFGLQALIGLVAGEVCPVLETELNGLCERIEARHEIGTSDNRGRVTVIHYTSIATLVSMLQNMQKPNLESADDRKSQDERKSYLRLYDSIHLNDPEEGNYLRKHLTSKYNWLERADIGHAYMSSFIMPKDDTNACDDLVYWCAYGQDGQGCSFSLSCPENRLRRVLYDPQELKATAGILGPVLDSVIPLTQTGEEQLREEVSRKLAESVWKSVARIRYLYKSEAYKHENECRFVLPKSSIDANADKTKVYLEYQDRGGLPGRIRHYYEDDDLQVTEKLLTSNSSITLGPCVPYRDNVRYCIERLNQQAGLAGPTVAYSKIPYRRL